MLKSGRKRASLSTMARNARCRSNFWIRKLHLLLKRIKLIWNQQFIHSSVTNVIQCSKPEMDLSTSYNIHLNG